MFWGSTNSVLLFGVVSCVGAFVLVVVVIAGWVCARCWCDLWCCDLVGVARGVVFGVGFIVVVVLILLACVV